MVGRVARAGWVRDCFFVLGDAGAGGVAPWFRFLFSGLMLIGLCGFAGSARAQQVGTSISADGSLPNANAMLDVASPATGDGKGLLIPRVTVAQRTTASAAEAGGLLDNAGELRGGAAQGLLVYQTDGTQGFYYNTSTAAAPSWVYNGNGVGDFMANGSVPMTGRLNMGGHSLTNVDMIAFGNSVPLGAGAQSYSSSSGSVAVGKGATARYRTSGVAVGAGADGDYNGVAVGYQADGQYSNIAIGYAASAYSGYDRIAIGRDITNRRNDSCVIRGSLYMDGGTGLLYRSTVGSGSWAVKAFTIDHPLDPANKVLRHYCLEGPEVWNVYAGNAQLMNGQAVVELPEYYSALNLAGSEVYGLTAVGGRSELWIAQEVKENAFMIAGDADVKVSWEIKVRRNDAACREDLKRRPVEQDKASMPPGQAGFENQGVNTGDSSVGCRRMCPGMGQ